MRDRVGSDHMVCPKCGVEQATAPECGFCGVVVAKYHRPGMRPEKVRWITGGVVFAAALMLFGIGMFWRSLQGVDLSIGSDVDAPLPPPPPTQAPDVVTPKDPSQLGIDWFLDASGFKEAVGVQIELKEPMIVYLRTRECADCTKIQAELLNGEAFRKWAGTAVKTRIVVDAGAAEAELAGKLGVTELPAVVVVRSDGKRVPVALYTGEPRALVAAEPFLAECRKAAAR